MKKNNTVEYLYLQHLITLIKDNMKTLPSMSNAVNDFESGKSLAYYEIADFIAECSQLFSLPLSDLGITEFNPDSLL